MEQPLTLGARIKTYEEAALTMKTLSAETPIVVRVDGKKFSSFTRGFKKPFDERLSVAFERTCFDLMKEFHPRTIYSQSDEISLIFFTPIEPGSKQPEVYAGGRTLKMASLIAGFTTARFNFHMCALKDKYPLDKVSEKMSAGVAYFDGRAFNLPEYEVLNYIIWRSHHDARRNSVANYARTVFGNAKLDRVDTIKMLDMLRDEGKPWDELPMSQRLGFFVKKYKYDKDCGDRGVVTRTDSAIYTRELTKWTEQDNQWLLSKYNE